MGSLRNGAYKKRVPDNVIHARVISDVVTSSFFENMRDMRTPKLGKRLKEVIRFNVGAKLWR